MKSGSGRRRIRLFALLSGALILASLVPLVVAEAVLIRRNRRTLETLEEKYLTRSSAAIADHIANYYDSAEQQLLKAVDVIQVAAHLTGKDPFNRNDAPEILKGALQVAGPLSALRAVNLQGQGSFVGPNVAVPAIDLEFRKGFESARDGGRYVGAPFDAGDLGAVAVMAAPVEDAPGSRIGVVEALVSWQPVAREFSDEARREVRATLVDGRGKILFPLGKDQQHTHPSTLVADFVRFPARVTRSESTPEGTVLASIAPVVDPPWGVLVERDQQLAFASVSGMIRDTLLWSAACLAGALLLGLFFARRLSRPIAHLADSTRAVTEGQYGTRVEVGGTAEIADLSENFNKMSESIHDAFERVQKAAKENQELFLASIRALAAAIDAKDPYTRGHSERVAALSVEIGRELGLDEAALLSLRYAGILHDIGKIGVPEQVLRKPDLLTAEERTLVRSHAVVGAEIVEGIDFLRPAEPGIRHHHERWDGAGYPDGLRGDAIPLLARIINAADTWDACTSERPYQRAYSAPEVVAILAQLRGGQIDPSVHDAILRVLQRRGTMKGAPAA